MDLGEYNLCLKVADLEKSMQFYQKLGFQIIEDQRNENWVVLQNNNMILSLYQGHIQQNLINFRGGDIPTIVEKASKNGIEFQQAATKQPDGSWSAEVQDPDGNVIFFDTYPEEREQYVKTGKLYEK